MWISYIKMMKIIKLMLFLTTAVLFMAVSFVVEAKDCSHVKKLHQKLICKAGSDIYDSGLSTTSDQTKKIEA